MNLTTNQRYPLLKFLYEELTGCFLRNELTLINRMVILYHNRYTLAIDDDVSGYLDEFQEYLRKRQGRFVYLVQANKSRVRQTTGRILFLLENNRRIFEGFLSREDYGSPAARRQMMTGIYDWLEKLPAAIHSDPALNIQKWGLELNARFGSGLLSMARTTRKAKNNDFEYFYQILAGKDEHEKQRQFENLVSLLVRAKWIVPTQSAGIYEFTNNRNGGRLWLAALYFVLCRNGYIIHQLKAPEVAALFNSWLSHKIRHSSFVKIFQAEQQDAFDSTPGQGRYKYIQDCSLLIRDL